MGVFKYLHIDWREVVGLLVLTLLGAATEMGLPTMLARMIDDGVTANAQGVIVGIALVMVVLALVGCVASLVSTFLSARVSTKLAADLRSQLFSKVQSFSSADMDRFGTASLVTRSTSDVSNVQMFVTMLMQIGVMAPLMLVAGIVLSSATGGRVSTVLLVSVPVLFILAGLIMRVVSRLSKQMRKRLDNLNRIFLETLEGVRPIRAFRREPYEIARFGEANAAHAQIAVEQGRLMALMMPLIGLVFGFTTTGVMWLGSGFVADGSMEVGALVANTQYISMILMSIMMVSAVIMMYPNFSACATRICEVLDAEPSIVDGKRSLEERTSRGKLEFQHVSFQYAQAEEPVLQDLTFTCEPGTVTAIIGPTGCGKSSVLRLIPRLFDATLGNVVIDGINVKRYKLEDLRSLIGYVPQKNVLFKGTIADNLNWGNEAGDDAAWQRALDIACASEFVSEKDDGARSEVAQGGTNFSGGQRQRLAIARAIMRDAEFYLFDDSFSALDMKTDRTLRENIRRDLSDATVIIVAQRVGTIIDADQIIVLDDGVCVGKGTHAELLASCEMYRDIATLQLGEQAVVDTLREAAGLPAQSRSKAAAQRVAFAEGGER